MAEPATVAEPVTVVEPVTVAEPVTATKARYIARCARAYVCILLGALVHFRAVRNETKTMGQLVINIGVKPQCPLISAQATPNFTTAPRGQTYITGMTRHSPLYNPHG